MKSGKKFIGLLIVLVLITCIFVACGDKSKTSVSDTTKSGKDLVTVKIGVTPYSMYAIWAIAQELGIDKDYGIKLELYSFTGTAGGAQACARGEIDVTSACVAEQLASSVGAENLVNFNVIGFFKGFFYVGRRADIQPYNELVAKVGAEEAKNMRINEFAGKTFCIIPQRKALILDTIAQVGLTEDDVKFMNFADDQKAAAAFLAGEGDFYIGSLPQQKALLREDSFVDAGGTEILGPAGLWYDTMMTTKEYLADNRETSLKLFAIYFSTVNAFDKDPNSVAPIAAEYLSKASGSEFSEADWLDMQTNYDDFQSLEQAAAGFYNTESKEYWRLSVQYQIDLLTSEGALTNAKSADYYYGGSQDLFETLIANTELVEKINSYK
jgi:ABC-type nitrate/sulfonate/bicarbonate transport system substrate-binding protein